MFDNQFRGLYYYLSDDIDEGTGEKKLKIGGYHKSYKNLKFLIVQNSGHLPAKT